MDAAQEARCKEMLDQILVMVTKMASDLEACNAAFRTAPPAFVADSDSSGREVDATTGTGYNSVLATLRSLASASASESKAAARSLADHDPSADRASSYIVVADQDSASVTPCIDRFVLATARSILYGRGFFFTVPSRATSNQVLGRPIGKHIFGDKLPAMATTRTLELTLISAKDLKDVNLLSKMEVYAMLSLSGDPLSRKCSMQGHGSDEVTTLSLCAFSMTAVAIKGTLHHEENTSELLRILMLVEHVKLLSFGALGMSIFGVFKDWQEQPWPPPMLVEILGSQVEDSIIELRPNPWPSFEHSVSLIHRVSYMLLSCDTNLQQLGNLTGFSIIWDVSILNLFADPSKCRVQIAAMICVRIVWCFPSEHVSVDYLLALFTMMALNLQREITMDWSSSAWYLSLYWDIQMEQMQNEDMILAHEKQWQNEKTVLCLKPWALYGHKQVTDQKVELRPWPSFSCYPTKACANALSYIEEQKALYVQTWRLINVLDWCQIHSINLNQVCFSEIQQLVGIHWKEIRSELRDNGTPPVQLKKASRAYAGGIKIPIDAALQTVLIFGAVGFLLPCENIGSETTCFLNASIQQILLQDNEAIVQGWLSGSDLKKVALFGCPTVERRTVFASKRLRAFFNLQEEKICSNCKLRSSCKFVNQEVARHNKVILSDTMRVISLFVLDACEQQLQVTAELKASVCKLLKDTINLSS
ncbi:unnamed protein product [Miscanthus lutarioriparius]|uniref:Uncharacterized protein n=1 Tax=Miscanthus lutarioriparius TaxID=422564 RepID=A0A811P539_9POAL|nr:unnamed protein product [Miscanthus lutarioriparius]